MNNSFVSKNRNLKFSYRIGLLIDACLSIPKTLYFNFRVLPFKEAVCFPFLVNHRVKLTELHKNIVRLPNSIYPFMIKIGFGGSEGIVPRKGAICLEEGSLLFKGKAVFSEGISIRTSGKITIGERFFCNRNCTIWSNESIEIGEDVLFGWNITLRDCDGHLIIHEGRPKPYQKPIIIGDHSWICSEVHVLKGAAVDKNCIVGYASLLAKPIAGDGLLIAGNPAKVVGENYNWEHG